MDSDLDKKQAAMILEYLKHAKITYAGTEPKPTLPMDENDKADLAKDAEDLNENRLVPIAIISDIELLRGDSGNFYFNRYGTFYVLGNTVNDVIQYLTGNKNFSNVEIIQSFGSRSIFGS